MIARMLQTFEEIAHLLYILLECMLYLHSSINVTFVLHRRSNVIQTPDRDVPVIACSAACDIPSQILLHTGTKHCQRIIGFFNIFEHWL